MKQVIVSLLSAAISLSTQKVVPNREESPIAHQHTYVLVHGAWQAPYVWNAVRDNLLKAGNKVIVLELPGHGTDISPTHTLSIDAYRDKVIRALSATNEKVILVGHSMGGMVISAVAEKVPDKISKLIYVGAFLPSSGQALTDLAFSDPDSKLGPLLIPSTDQLTLDVRQDSLVALFIPDGPKAEQERVIAQYRAEPAIPFTSKALLTPENFGSVEKVYIKTLQDIVISPGLQDRMIAAAGIKSVFTINTSHSPFLSQPDELSKLLIDATTQSQAVARLTRYEVKQAYQEAFKKALSEYVLQSLSNENNIMAEAHHEQDNSKVLWLMERWSNKDALEKNDKEAPSKAVIKLSEQALMMPAKYMYIRDLEPLSKAQWRKTSLAVDSQLTVMLFVNAKEGTQEQFKKIYNAAMPQFRSEPGVVTYQLSALEEDQSQFVTYEKFRSKNAFQFHLDFPPIQPVIDYLQSSIKKQPFQDGLHTLIEFAPLTRE